MLPLYLHKRIMMENDTLLKLRPSDIPPTLALCFNAECPHRAQCMRFFAGQIANQERDHGQTVFPSSLKADGTCRFFFQLRVIRVAWGFRPLFKTIRHEDYAAIRWRVKRKFGSDRNFYRYNRGEYKLTPERQAEVLDIFKRYGYDTTNLHFEHYEEQVDFIGT